MHLCTLLLIGLSLISALFYSISMETIVSSQTTDENSVEIVGSPHLAEDVIFEILSWVSLETLKECRLVCKGWNHVICNPSFRKLYRERNKILSGFLIPWSDFHQDAYTSYASHSSPLPKLLPLTLNFLPVGNEIVNIRAASNQGLVYCEGFTGIGLIDQTSRYVCKPTTGEWVKIPDSGMNTSRIWRHCAMIVLQSRPLHYKIVRLHKPHPRKNTFVWNPPLVCEIFDSEKGAWKVSESIKSSFGYLTDEPPVFTSGAFHWFTYSLQIFALDINNGKSQLIDLPENLLGHKTYYYLQTKKPLVQYQGKLAFLRYAQSEDKVEIWVMENYSSRSWKLAREIENLERKETIQHFYTSDVAVMSKGKDLIWYDFHKGTKFTSRGTAFLISSSIYPFESDYKSMF